MQDFLTAAIGAIALASTVYFSAGFVSIVLNHVPPTVRAKVELPTQEEVDAVVAELTIAAAPLAVEQIAPHIQPPAPDWSAIAPAQLRKECSARAIKWRNFHGRNQHLKKAEMVAALQA